MLILFERNGGRREREREREREETLNIREPEDLSRGITGGTALTSSSLICGSFHTKTYQLWVKMVSCIWPATG